MSTSIQNRLRQVGDTDVITLSQTQEVHREIAALLAKMRALAGLKGENVEPPVREKPQYEPGQGFGGGMFGGYGAGMGGMGGIGGDRAQVISVQPAGQAGDDLLQGLNDANKEFQGKQLEEMKRMFERGGMGGMGGVGAGGFF